MTDVVHEIAIDDLGNRHGTDGVHTVTLRGTEGRMFKRRAVKDLGGGASEETCWLVAELNGVRVYQHGAHIVVTTEDLYP